MELLSSEQKNFFERAASQYQIDLASDTSAQEYLRGRGIGPQTAATYRLGVVRNPLPSQEVFRDRLAIPYLTPNGIATFTFRCLADHVCKDTVLGVSPEGKPYKCRKYRAPGDMDRTLYNVLDFQKPSSAIYVCEGEIDALTLSACGFPAIGVPGVNSWKPYFTRCFSDYTQVLSVADGDDAGRKMARFLAAELKARPLCPPRGEDINSIYSKGGADAVRTWLSGATT